MRRVPLLIAVLIIPYTIAHAEEPDAEVQRCIKQLGADSFEDRNAAETQVLKLGVRAKAALESAVKSEDAEVQLRATRLLPQILDLDARENEAAWSERIGVGLGALKLNAPAAQVNPPNDGAARAQTEGERTLDWLAHAQEADGHWDSKKYGAQMDGDLAQTGLALLAFLGAGHTEKVGAYKFNVQRAVEWLKSRQRADGAFCNKAEAVDGITQAVAGLAMAEAAGMARRPDTVASAQKGIDYSTKIHQSKIHGELSGWGRAKDSKTPNLFVTTFFVMQMKSAKVAGLSVPHESFDAAIKFLDSVQDGKEYRPQPGGASTPQLTLMADLARQFLGFKKKDLADSVSAALKSYGPPSKGLDTSDDLTNYFGTLAVFQQGGDLWKNWNDKLKKELVEKQLAEGSESGAWRAAGVWAGAGQVTATALNALTLEVYYRYKQLAPDH